MPTIDTPRGPVSTGESIFVRAHTNPARGGDVTIRNRAGLRFDDRQIVAVKVLDLPDDVRTIERLDTHLGRQVREHVRTRHPELEQRLRSGQYVTNLDGVAEIIADDALSWWKAADLAEHASQPGR